MIVATNKRKPTRMSQLTRTFHIKFLSQSLQLIQAKCIRALSYLCL
ncbi:hypothetical protein A0O32_2432 [Anoxybacillus flavithermus]|nr:hypothetical protein A0O32_2432 [Anoxybacillus flavithermus]